MYVPVPSSCFDFLPRRLLLLAALVLWLVPGAEAQAQNLVGRYKGSVTMTTSSGGVSVSKSQAAGAIIAVEPEDPAVWTFRVFSIVEDPFGTGFLGDRFTNTLLDKQTRKFLALDGTERTLVVNGTQISFTLRYEEEPFVVTHRYILRKQ